jgi:hypothetical protein
MSSRFHLVSTQYGGAFWDEFQDDDNAFTILAKKSIYG